jgi:hypothetical protein
MEPDFSSSATSPTKRCTASTERRIREAQHRAEGYYRRPDAPVGVSTGDNTTVFFQDSRITRRQSGPAAAAF